MKEKINNLYNHDNNIAHKALLEIETITTESNELYEYFDLLLDMLKNEKAFIRVRGFRLICSLAKWDKDNKINNNIDEILNNLNDYNATNIRQYLSKINLILMYKIELTEIITNKLKNMDLTIYKESMQSLIQRDINKILNNI